MRFGLKLGTSLLAVIVALPVVPATVSVAQAQGLLDSLFRKPAKRQRAKRAQSRQVRQRRATRTVRRQRVQQRQTVRKKAAPQRVAKKQAKRQTKKAAPRRAAPIQTIRNVGFLDYTPERMMPIDIASTANVVSAAFAAERALLEANPIIRQLAPEAKEARASDAVLDRALSARALMPPAPKAEGEDIVARINAVAGAAAGEEPVVAEPTPAPVAPAPAAVALAPTEDVLAAVNDAAGEGAELGAGLDLAPRFSVRRDPRIAQLANAEAAWAMFGQQSARATQPVANAVQEFYETERRLIWTNGRRVRPSTASAVAVMRDAAAYGLDPTDYRVPPIPGPDAGTDEHMAFELAMTVAVAEYMRDATAGRIVADDLSGYHDLPRKDAKLNERLREIASTAAPDELLLDAHPKNKHFQALRAELSTLRNEKASPLPELPKGVMLRAGRESEYVPALMKLLNARASGDTLAKHADAIAAYDGGNALPAELDGFVRDVQRDNELSADGIIGPRSIARLNGESNETKIERLELALERMRWLPDDDLLSGEYVFINQPAYRVQHWRDENVQLSMRVVVGKNANQTNFFYDEISHIEFNPDWGVPRSIIVNEYLPKLQRDPSYLDRIGYVVRDSRGRKVRSSRVNWAKYGANVPYNVVQPPGPRNALGELKIEFPNRHAIYMHDTNAKSLFNNRTRAYSHGCVRLHKPREMAASVLGTDLADVRRRLAKGHHNAKIDRRIPVMIAYFTAFTKDDGTIGYYADMYGRDKALRKAIEKTRAERRGDA